MKRAKPNRHEALLRAKERVRRAPHLRNRDEIQSMKHPKETALVLSIFEKQNPLTSDVVILAGKDYIEGRNNRRALAWLVSNHFVLLMWGGWYYLPTNEEIENHYEL